MATPLSKLVRKVTDPVQNVLDPVYGAIQKVADPVNQLAGIVGNPLDPIGSALAGSNLNPMSTASNVSPVQRGDGYNFLGQTEVELDRNIIDKIGGFVGGIKPTLTGQGSAYRSTRASERESAVSALNNERMTALAKDAFSVNNLLKSGDIEGAMNILNRRVSAIGQLGGDPEDTQMIIDRITNGDVSGAVKELDLTVNRAKELGYLEKSGTPIAASNLTASGEVLTSRKDGTFELIKVKGWDAASAPRGYQFGAQVEVKDSEGNTFLATQKVNPNSGEAEAVFSSLAIDGPQKPVGKVEIVGTYGLTASERVEQIAQEGTAKEQATAAGKELASIKSSGLKARSMIPKTERLIELNALVETGKTAEARKYMADLFNLDSEDAANLGEFNALAGQMVLGQIRQLGANPTEGERGFLLDLSAGIGQGNVVNAAILRDLLSVQRRQVARAKMLAANPTMTLNDVLLLEESDFQSEGKPPRRYNPATKRFED